MNDIIEKLRETCKENKTELLLMALFLLCFAVICGPELAAEVSSAQVQTEREAETEQEAESDSEAETEVETETETESPEEAALRRKRMKLLYGSDFRIPMALPEKYELANLQYVTLRYRKELYGYDLPEVKSEGEQLEGLRNSLAQRIAGYDGSWSVYVKNLSTGESLVINDQPMHSASVMKLFVMGTVYKAFESGELERTDEVMSLMKQMISASDNEATNELLYRLGDGSYAYGIDHVNEFIRSYGFSGMTVEYNGFDNSATVLNSERYNQVSARDCGKLLEDIYRRTWVSRSVSNEMEEMLLAQSTRYKIPAGLPEGVLCGNKTGEMSATENDAAIIYGEDCDYILVVLSSGWSSGDEAISRIREISAETYTYLNGNGETEEESETETER